MVLQGAKAKTPDVDMLVSSGGWNKLLEELDTVFVADPPRRAVDAGADNQTLKISGLPMPVEVTDRVGDGHYPISFETHKEFEVYVYDVIPCLPLEMIHASKQALARPRDIEDITLIERKLGGIPI